MELDQFLVLFYSNNTKPSLEKTLFSYAILGFALTEAVGLLALMMAFLIYINKNWTYENIYFLLFYNIIFISFFIVKTNIILFFPILEIIQFYYPLFLFYWGYIWMILMQLYFLFIINYWRNYSRIAVTYLVLYYRTYGILKLSYVVINKV